MNPDKMSSTKTGPYRTIKAEVDDWYVVQGPTMVFGSHGWMELHEANILCDRLNAAYAAGQESSRWIPVSERLPEGVGSKKARPVIIRHNVDGDSLDTLAKFDDGGDDDERGWYWYDTHKPFSAGEFTVTHWLETPPLPKH